MRISLLMCMLIVVPSLVVVSGCHSVKKVTANDTESGTDGPLLTGTDAATVTDADSVQTATDAVSTADTGSGTATDTSDTDSPSANETDTSVMGTSSDTEGELTADTETQGNTDDTLTSVTPDGFPGCVISSSYSDDDQCSILLSCNGEELSSNCDRDGDNLTCTCEIGRGELALSMPVPEGPNPCLGVVDVCNSPIDESAVTIACEDTEEVRWSGPRCESVRPCTRTFELPGGILATGPSYTYGNACTESESGWACSCYYEDRPPHDFYMSDSDAEPCTRLAAICDTAQFITITAPIECELRESLNFGDRCERTVECRQPATAGAVDIILVEDLYATCSATETDGECACSCHGGPIQASFTLSGELTSVCDTAYDSCFSGIEWTDIMDTDLVGQIVFPDTD